MDTHKYTLSHIYTYTLMNTHRHTHIYNAHSYIIHIYTYIQPLMDTHRHAYLYIQVHAYNTRSIIYIYTHAYTHIYTFTHILPDTHMLGHTHTHGQLSRKETQ